MIKVRGTGPRPRPQPPGRRRPCRRTASAGPIPSATAVGSVPTVAASTTVAPTVAALLIVEVVVTGQAEFIT